MLSLRRSLLAISVQLIVVTLVASGPTKADPANAPEQAFAAVYAAFVDAVRANDKNKIADLVEFPVSAWAVITKGNVQEISITNKADFLAKYDSIFTPSMRSHAVKTKPQKIDNGHYALIWHDTDLEYSFEFESKPTSGFRLTMYLIGPR
jgi:hypothetical protein